MSKKYNISRYHFHPDFHTWTVSARLFNRFVLQCFMKNDHKKKQGKLNLSIQNSTDFPQYTF
jgi:hypothetical protein